jgi:digeranylgeranylglycerophospholipid reductase
MKRNEYDVVVIGAGPGGSVAARSSAKQGLSTLLIEKREHIGIPVRCGEASTKLKHLQEEFGPIDLECIETELNGLYVYGPGGIELDCKMPGVGVMLNREKFDPHLSRLAESDGAEVVTFARAASISEPQNGFRTLEIVTANGTEKVRAKMVIAADGVESRIGRMAGLDTRQLPGTTCTGVDIQVEGLLTRPDYLTFWQGADYINNGYIWSFPKQKSNVTNFGAGFLVTDFDGKCIEDVAFEWLHRLFPNAKPTGHNVGGLVPVSGNLPHTVKDSLILVGDAAHHTNPLTGGGIATAMRGGLLAAQVAGMAIRTGDLSESYLRLYEKLCMQKFGKKHLQIMRFRRFLTSRTREDQIRLYKIIRTYLEGDQHAISLLKMPLETLKFAVNFLRFK